MYSKKIERRSPGCFILLLDQSYSMSEPMSGDSNRSRAQSLATHVNRLLHSLVSRASKTGQLRHYFDIGVIGYRNESAESALAGSLARQGLVSIVDIGNNPLRVDEQDGIKSPVWVEPVAEGGTPMCAALNLAGAQAKGWVDQHKSSFPPVIINITDGRSTDGDPKVWAERLRTLGTDDGKLLLFNVALSSNGSQPIEFPGTPNKLPDEYARLLFEISSTLPPSMTEMLPQYGVPVAQGARGFVYNANIDSVVRVMNVGTDPRVND